MRFGGAGRHLGGEIPNCSGVVVGEVETGVGRLTRVSVGPECIEVRVRVQRTADVRVIACAGTGQLSHALPVGTFVAAFPQDNLAAGISSLRARVRWCEDAPGA